MRAFMESNGQTWVLTPFTYDIETKPSGLSIMHIDAFVEHFEKTFPPKGSNMPTIKRVIFNDPATIIMWEDGTKTVVKCQQGDRYDRTTGFLMAVVKKACGNKGNYNNLIRRFVKEDDGE